MLFKACGGTFQYIFSSTTNTSYSSMQNYSCFDVSMAFSIIFRFHSKRKIWLKNNKVVTLFYV